MANSHDGSLAVTAAVTPIRIVCANTLGAALRQSENAALSSYAWVDRSRGFVRIPIDRALALTTERGLPGWRRP